MFLQGGAAGVRKGVHPRPRLPGMTSRRWAAVARWIGRHRRPSAPALGRLRPARLILVTSGTRSTGDTGPGRDRGKRSCVHLRRRYPRVRLRGSGGRPLAARDVRQCGWSGLAPSVHGGDGDQGFVPLLIDLRAAKRESRRTVGDGRNFDGPRGAPTRCRLHPLSGSRRKGARRSQAWPRVARREGGALAFREIRQRVIGNGG